MCKGSDGVSAKPRGIASMLCTPARMDSSPLIPTFAPLSISLSPEGLADMRHTRGSVGKMPTTRAQPSTLTTESHCVKGLSCGRGKLVTTNRDGRETCFLTKFSSSGLLSCRCDSNHICLVGAIPIASCRCNSDCIVPMRQSAQLQ
jgi:hypothetical protein